MMLMLIQINCESQIILINSKLYNLLAMSRSCEKCCKLYASRSTLNRHVREVHQVEENQVVSHDFHVHHNKCLEKNCNSSFRTLQDLRNHLQSAHAISVIREDLEFVTFDEFLDWLSEISNKGNIRYIKSTTQPTKIHRITYYYCNRGNIYTPSISNENRKRKLKKQGSCRLNMGCTSTVTVHQCLKTKICTVVYFKTHYNHPIELQHIRLLPEDRLAIARKLMKGESPSSIRTTSASIAAAVAEATARKEKKTHLAAKITECGKYCGPTANGPTISFSSFRQSFTTNVNYLKRRFSSGDLSSECEDGGDAPIDPYAKPPVTAQPQAPPPPPPSQSSTSSDLSLNLRSGSKTTSAPSSPAKSRESLLQRVQSLTGQARDQGASILGAAVSSATSRVSTGASGRHITILVIDDQNTDWGKYFRGRRIGDCEIRVEQAEFGEISVTATPEGATVSMTVLRGGTRVGRSFRPDFVLVRKKHSEK